MRARCGRWSLSLSCKGLGGDDHQRGFRVKSPQRIRNMCPVDVRYKVAGAARHDRATAPVQPSQAPDQSPDTILTTSVILLLRICRRNCASGRACDGCPASHLSPSTSLARRRDCEVRCAATARSSVSFILSPSNIASRRAGTSRHSINLSNASIVARSRLVSRNRTACPRVCAAKLARSVGGVEQGQDRAVLHRRLHSGANRQRNSWCPMYCRLVQYCADGGL